MSNSFVKLLVSQLFANLADIFFRVTIIANIYIISKSVIATSLVPILIGISSFVASLLVPLVTKRLALNRVLSLSQFGKTILLAILVGMFTVMQSVAPLVTYLFVVAISILDGFAAPVSYAIVPRYATDLGKANSGEVHLDVSIEDNQGGSGHNFSSVSSSSQTAKYEETGYNNNLSLYITIDKTSDATALLKLKLNNVDN
ncbi:transporter major facilitator family protein [Streptococcus pneumoniae]|nr:transporter major facilitator family protein [Streptococcus pneumoniae]